NKRNRKEVRTMLRNKALLFVFAVAILIVGAVPIYKLVVSSKDDVAKVTEDAKTSLASDTSSEEEGSAGTETLASAGATDSEEGEERYVPTVWEMFAKKLGNKHDSKDVKALIDAYGGNRKAVAEMLNNLYGGEATSRSVASHLKFLEGKEKLLHKYNWVQWILFILSISGTLWFVLFHRYVEVLVPSDPDPIDQEDNGRWRPRTGEEPEFMSGMDLGYSDELEDEENGDGAKKKEYMRIRDISSGDAAYILSYYLILLSGWLVSNYFESFVRTTSHSWLPEQVHWIGIFIFVTAMMMNALLAFASYIVVPARQRWIQEFMGREEIILFSGLHFRLPIKHNKEIPVVVKKEVTEGDQKREPTGTIQSQYTVVRSYLWDVPDYAKGDLRENTDDLAADSVLCRDGWKPTIDLLLAFAMSEVDPRLPIRGAGMRDQPPFKYCYSYKRFGKEDDLTQGLESEADTAVRQWASLVPYVPPFDENDLKAYEERTKEGNNPELIALNSSQYYLTLAVIARLQGSFDPEGLRPEERELKRKAWKAVMKAAPVAVVEHICPKAGLVLRSVQTKKLIPPEKYDKIVGDMRTGEGEAKAAVYKAEGEAKRLRIEAEGHRDAQKLKGQGEGLGIKALADEAGLSTESARDTYLTREGQQAFKDAAVGSNSTVLSVPGSVGGTDALIAAGKTVFPDGKPKTGEAKEPDPKKPEGGKPE
ncbi:MAG: hypothetical protein V2A65_10655, partial [Candidatus Omnitrophota bacterium]